ncbi:MAG: metallophosphoesterase [Ruminococcus sp.]|nr:metallophosphoesterase [Ruminococcus sp.]
MKRKTLIKLMLALLFAVCIICEILFSANFLNISALNIKTDKTTASFKAVLVSDLHNKEYGKGNKTLLKTIYEQEPDVIFAVGDMLNKGDKNRKIAIDFYSELSKIASVYCCLGNHEDDYYDLEGLKLDMRKAGVNLLYNEMETVDFQSGSITVGALGYYPSYEGQEPEYNNPARFFLDDFIKQEDENFSILLMHQPEYFCWKLKEKKLDLILCGHTHGGIVRLPFIGGLIAPNQGILAHNGDILPDCTKGYYSSGTANMYITGGLGNEVFVPRFYNPPEISVINVN